MVLNVIYGLSFLSFPSSDPACFGTAFLGYTFTLHHDVFSLQSNRLHGVVACVQEMPSKESGKVNLHS
jgi:hypothetical protein